MKTCAGCSANIEDRNNHYPYCGTKCVGSGESEKPVYSLPDNPSANVTESTSANPRQAPLIRGWKEIQLEHRADLTFGWLQ